MAKSPSRTRDATSHRSQSGARDNLSHLSNPYNISSAAEDYRRIHGLDRRLYRPDESTRPPTHRTPLASRVILQVIKIRKRKRQFHARLPWRKYNPEYQAKKQIRLRLGFNIPRRLETCARRAIRKEVIFATKKAGKSGQKKPIRNFWSAISCRRK